MNQRGSVGLYLLFSIAVSIATGYGVYTVIHENKRTAPPPPVVATRREPPPPAPAAVVETPQPTPPVEAPEPLTVAESRAVDPVVDESGVISPLIGTPGIDGPIEQGSVGRRMRAKSAALQSCWERTNNQRITVRMTMHIDAEGRVTNARVSSGLTAPTEACIVAVLSSLSFSAPGREAEVVQPIAFR